MITELATFDGAQAVPPALPAAATASGSSAALLSPTEVMTAVDDDELDAGALQSTLRRQNLCIHELQTVLRECAEEKTKLGQRYQEVAAERDYYRRELQKLRVAAAPPLASPDAAPPPRLTRTAKLSLPPPARPGADLPARQRSHPSQPIQPLKLPETRSEEHTSELQSQSTISYAVFCLKKKKKKKEHTPRRANTTKNNQNN